MGQATFSANSNYKIDVDAALVSQNGPGNYSTIYWRIIVHKLAGSGYMATTNTGNSGWADSNLGGNPDLWSNGNMSYNFQNGQNTGSFTIAEGTFNIGHHADGNQDYYVTGGLSLANLGSASATTGARALPRIQTATVPGAPVPVGFGEITMDSIQYLFSGTTDGGSPVREWQALFQEITASGSENGSQVPYASNGSTNLTPLKPGTHYRFWSRGRNDIGWGPWSNASEAKTIAGARVKHNGVWKEAVPYVKINGVWQLAQPYTKRNGSWRKSI